MECIHTRYGAVPIGKESGSSARNHYGVLRKSHFWGPAVVSSHASGRRICRTGVSYGVQCSIPRILGVTAYPLACGLGISSLLLMLPAIVRLDTAYDCPADAVLFSALVTISEGQGPVRNNRLSTKGFC